MAGLKKYEFLDRLFKGVVRLLLFLEKEVALLDDGQALVVELLVVQSF